MIRHNTGSTLLLPNNNFELFTSMAKALDLSSESQLESRHPKPFKSLFQNFGHLDYKSLWFLEDLKLKYNSNRSGRCMMQKGLLS